MLVHRERGGLLTQRDKRTLTGTKSSLVRLLEQKVFQTRTVSVKQPIKRTCPQKSYIFARFQL